MDEQAIGEKVLGCAVRVHRALGPGLLESAYEACLAHEMESAGLKVERQLVLPIVYRSQTIEGGYRVDLLVEKRVVVEVKAVEKLLTLHRAQVLSYLKLGGYKLGYLLKFNLELMKDGIVRIAHRLETSTYERS